MKKFEDTLSRKLERLSYYENNKENKEFLIEMTKKLIPFIIDKWTSADPFGPIEMNYEYRKEISSSFRFPGGGWRDLENKSIIYKVDLLIPTSLGIIDMFAEKELGRRILSEEETKTFKTLYADAVVESIEEVFSDKILESLIEKNKDLINNFEKNKIKESELEEKEFRILKNYWFLKDHDKLDKNLFFYHQEKPGFVQVNDYFDIFVGDLDLRPYIGGSLVYYQPSHIAIQEKIENIHEIVKDLETTIESMQKIYGNTISTTPMGLILNNDKITELTNSIDNNAEVYEHQVDLKFQEYFQSFKQKLEKFNKKSNEIKNYLYHINFYLNYIN